jgi:diguanylate cyclase (GGDEF)-like protein
MLPRMARFALPARPPAPPNLALRLPMLLALATLLATVAALGINQMLADRLLRADATARAEAWGAELARRAPDLPAGLRGAALSEAARAALAGARLDSGILRYRLIAADGSVLLAAGGMDAAGQPAPAAALAMASVPIGDTEGPAGTLEALLDQGPRRALYHQSFLLAGISIGLLGGCAALVLAWIALRRRREQEAEARALFLQRHDALTGLATHAEFRERLETALSLAQRQNWQVGVLVVDLRRFTEVNEAHGRSGGDAVLGLLAARLRGIVRREDTVARLAADRFAVVQTALQDGRGVARLAQRLAATLASPFTLPAGAQVSIAADLGFATAPADGQDAETLLARAEAALSAARALPEPAIRCFEPALDIAHRRQRDTLRDLRAAIAEGGLTLHYQPQRRLRDRALLGFEALLRWPHAERGMIPPSEFIPLAEQSGLIVPLGAWVIRAACAEAARWPAGVSVAVNLSPAQFRHGGLVATVADALASTGLPADRLELEITESLLQQDTEETVRLLQALRGLGVSIAMDDFGTGWSSLAHLWRFPFGKLKIDRAFVRDLGRDPRLTAIIATVVGLGRTLDMTVVAEGVETEAQARLLAAEGCEQVQGWLFGRPMPAEAARALIAEEARAGTRKVA